MSEHGTITADGVTVTSNQQTSEEMRASLEPPVPEPVEAVAETPVVETPEPAPTKQAARKSQAAKIQQQSAEIGNKEQTIQTLNERILESDRRFEALQKEIEALKAPKAPAPAPAKTPEARPATPSPIDWSGFTLKEPTIDDFADQADPYAAYLRAAANYDRKKDAYEAKQIDGRERQQAARHQAFTDRAERFQQRLTQHQQADEGYSARVEALLSARGNPPMPPPMFEVLTESEVGPQLFEYLLEHEADLRRVLSAPSAKAQYGELKKLEARVEAAGSSGSAPPVKRTTTAHPPINPVVGSHPAPKDGPPGDDASYEEHEAYWNRVEREQKQARAGRRA